MFKYRGRRQFIQYGSSSSNLYYTVTDDEGRERKPDSAPTIAIQNPAGTSLLTATSMTAVTVSDEGFLDYDAQTAAFNLGETLTGGTSGATGIITEIYDSGTEGTLALSNIDGTFANNEAITDSGDVAGAATANLAAYSCTYYYALDASSTTNYEIGRNYILKFSITISSKTYTRYLYVDVDFFPMTAPLISSGDIMRKHPGWLAYKPSSWSNWKPAIEEAHQDLIDKIYEVGEQGSHYVNREAEMAQIQMAFAEAAIARACQFPEAERMYWENKASQKWASRGKFTFDSDSDEEIDDDTGSVISSGFTR